MDDRDRLPLERNEAGWWSFWGELEWLGTWAYLLTSSEFDEALFNRLGVVSSKLSETDTDEALARLGKRRESCVAVYESSARAEGAFTGRGYAIFDVMNVMRMGKETILTNAEVAVSAAGARDLKDWSEVYLTAFYGSTELRRKVLKVVRGLAGRRDVTLLVARLEGKAVGVTALFRSPGVLGLYCLGTLPGYRGNGVARTLLAEAWELAKQEKRALVLQSLGSEETEPFYRRFGFELLYRKVLLKMPSPVEHGSMGRTRVEREPGVGPHLFTAVFKGFEEVDAVKGIFGEGTRRVLSELSVEVTDDKGYMHINATKGSIIVSAPYLKEGRLEYLYLDVVHELVHIRQHIEGKELWDRTYKYVDRPTELEAYRVAVAEARRIGFDDRDLVEYLKVEWVSEEEFARFLVTLGVTT